MIFLGLLGPTLGYELAVLSLGISADHGLLSDRQVPPFQVHADDELGRRIATTRVQRHAHANPKKIPKIFSAPCPIREGPPIADVFKKGVTEDQENMADAKRLMWLLGELSDPEVLLLAWYNMGPEKDEAFRTKHWQVIRPRSAETGQSQEKIDEYTLYENRKTHMANLGLMRPRFKHVRKGESPEFDPKTGMMKASGYEVTPLGRLLMRTINAK